MSWDIFLQRFDRGDAGEADGDLVVEILRPFFAHEPVDGFVRLRTPDGEADVYLKDPKNGLMVNHVSGVAIWDLLADLASRTSLTILPVGSPACVVSENAIRDLPEELQRDVRVTRSGRDLRMAALGS